MKEGLREWHTPHSKALQKADFEIKVCPIKGRTVIALRPFLVGEFVLEYEGDFVTRRKMKWLEKQYEASNTGSFYIECRWNQQAMAIDGAPKQGTLGSLVNHLRGGNLQPHGLLRVDKGQPPRLAMRCAHPIERGDELSWDYGIRDNETTWASNKRPR